VAAEIVAIAPDHSVTIDAIELHYNAPAAVGRRDGKGAAVAADGACGKEAADRLVAVGLDLRVIMIDEREFDRPVVGQVNAAPEAVAEIGVGRALGFAGLGKGGADTETEIEVRIGGVAGGELPAEIEEQLFPRRLGQGDDREE